MYCEKCRKIEEGGEACPFCGRRLMREAQPADMVLLCTADPDGCEALSLLLTDHKIEFETIEESLQDAAQDESEVSASTSLYVQYQDLSAAEALLPSSDEEPAQNAEETMPPKKRMLVQIGSMILFIAAVCAVVYAADWIAELVKSLFTA